MEMVFYYILSLYKSEISKSLYDGKKTRADFLIYNPTKKGFIFIECKWQSSGGTVDEKFPYLVSNIKQNYQYETIIVLDGGGYTKGAEKWLKNQANGKIKKVISLAEFIKLGNNDFF